MVKILECEQGTSEWANARKGVITASRMSRIFTSLGKPSASRRALACELIAERIVPAADYWVDDYISPAMERGTVMEREARLFYEMERGVDVQQVGLCLSDDGRIGCSPDGLVGDAGGLELKCPIVKTQVDWLLDNKVPAEHVVQVHGCLVVTGRAYWDFVSYAPFLPPLLVRVEPDDFTEKLRAALKEFADYVDDLQCKVLASGVTATQQDAKQLLTTSPF